MSAQKVFVQLLTIPGDNKEAVRRLAKRNEINDWNLVVRLANKRLVVTNRDVTTKVETVEIIHEALIRNWDRLKEWIRNDRYFRIWQDQLRQSIAKWKQTQRDSGSLLRGLQLVEAKKWLQNKQGDLGRDEVEYINASVKQERKSRRQLQIGIAVSTMIAAIATGLGFFANGQRFIAQEQTKNAQEQTREAEKQKLIAQRQKLIAQREASIANLRAKAIEAINLLSSNPVEGLVKTMAVFAQTKKSQLEKELPRVRYSLSEFIDKAREEVRIAHSDSVRSVASSPDGTKIASASGNTVKVWDLLTGEELAQFTGHTGFVNSVAFSPDGTKIASASDDLTVRLWDLSGRELAQFIGHAGYVNSVAFSPDGRKIASASNDKTVRLWDLSGRQLAQFTGHANVLTSSPA